MSTATITMTATARYFAMPIARIDARPAAWHADRPFMPYIRTAEVAS